MPMFRFKAKSVSEVEFLVEAENMSQAAQKGCDAVGLGQVQPTRDPKRFFDSIEVKAAEFDKTEAGNLFRVVR
jgi:hypothetical protein